ncbi:hypothetical protein M407DRAFT_192336 [Tulasnella calospora MUT 4182]|uniref:Septin-type G domain-containing protein n=1 Tax=Tulasnella calospora MUT 4182 TaxID=1051891 RepID=A0A0C3QWX6_9AGAM|nr:hypothetical protein M407DRAFT_192336 [Tulasnella calospora MUT 4182]
MVLGITLRRKKTKDGQAPIRLSPSLPNISSTGLSTSDWPEGFDIKTIKKEVHEHVPGPNSPTSTEHDYVFVNEHGQSVANGKTSFQSGRGTIRSFHRPFRPNEPTAGGGKAGERADMPGIRQSIASMYANLPPPSAFGNTAGQGGKAAARRVVRIPPKFNVMVAGGRGTGKTSFLNLFLNTCDIAPTATEAELAFLKKFTDGPTRQTKSLRAVSIEVCEERHDRIHLTVIDTAGLDFEEGRELELERSVQSMMRYIDTQYAETMGEESKVVRQNKGDQHVHLCIYLIDPDTIMRPTARHAKSRLPFRLRSQSTLTRRASLSSITSTETSSSSDNEDEEAEPAAKGEDVDTPAKASPLRSTDETMAPAEIKVLKRLSTRCNILPVIARADTLTDERLATIKRVVRRDLANVGLGFGVFEPVITTVTTSTEVKTPQRKPSKKVHIKGEDEDEVAEESEEERPTRPVIKLRSPRAPATRERSRSRRRMLDLDDEDEAPPPPQTPQTPSHPPAAWPAQPKTALSTMLPFAFVSPEEPPRTSSKDKKKKSAEKELPTGETGDQPTSPPADASSNAGDIQSRRTSVATSVAGSRRPSIKGSKVMIRGPADWQGQFVRRYRWGTIDVLNPSHCDFVALRAAVLGSHMRALKKNTKEVLYERFRTEKLLARRATSAFSDADRTKMLSELGV